MRKRFIAVLSVLLAAVLAVSSSGCVILLNPAETESTETVAPTTEPTEEPTTELETEDPAVSYYKGTWQGSDSNVTTIVIKEDGTLFYREINSAKIPTVQGMDGTWTAADTKVIKISIPGLGAGYELEGTVVGDGVLLKCTNGQPWGDEIIRKSNISPEEIEAIAEKRIKELSRILPADGAYFLERYFLSYDDDIDYVYDSNAKMLKVKCKSGCYIHVTEEGVETNCAMFKSEDSGAVTYPAGSVKYVPGKPEWWLGYPVGIDPAPIQYEPFENWGRGIAENFGKNKGYSIGFLDFLLIIRNGQIDAYQFLP